MPEGQTNSADSSSAVITAECFPKLTHSQLCVPIRVNDGGRDSSFLPSQPLKVTFR